MEHLELFESAPLLRPMLNVGCLFDIPTGRYYTGKHGESILNGGLAYNTGIGGLGNMFKSTVAHYFGLTAFSRYTNSTMNVYDTEISVTIARLQDLLFFNPAFMGDDLEGCPRFRLTSSDKMLGDKWFDAIKMAVKARQKEFKKYSGTTPFLDRDGTHLKALMPFIAEVDSLSTFTVETIADMHEKNSIGASGNNTDSLRGAGAKSQMLFQLPGVTAGGGCYMIMTAHMGAEHQLDPRAIPTKKLTYMKQKITFKNVPQNFTMLTNNCWYVTSATQLINDTTKQPEFPRNSDDDLKGDTDLMLLTIQNLRAKNGPTGLPFEVIVSQSEGMCVGLSEFNYIRKYERFGLGGNVQNYYLELLPDVKLSRTTVRGKLDDNVALQRAMTITSELCQIINLWHNVDEKYLCTPKELYDDLIAKGYDWDVLLDTRGFWVYEEDEPFHKPFLSTMDLLKIRVGEYHPWWLPAVKAKPTAGLTLAKAA